MLEKDERIKIINEVLSGIKVPSKDSQNHKLAAKIKLGISKP